MRTLQYSLIGLVLIGVALWVAYGEWTPPPRTAEPFKVGLVTWIGYAPIYVAKERHYFDQEGISVDVRNMDQPGSREAAFATGQLDFFPNTPDAFTIIESEERLPGKIIAAFDRSYGADGIVARDSIQSLADLKGKTVGFQKGITSHFLLLYFLHSVGLSGAGIKQVSLSADDAGASFMAGQLDAAATWEPWLSKAREAQGSHVLADSSEMGDRIVDVLMVSDRVVHDPKKARAFMNSWYKGLEYMNTHPSEANVIIASALQVKPADIPKMESTVRYLSKFESEKYLLDRLPNIGDEISTLYVKEKLIRHPTELRTLIAPHLLYDQVTN